jgi:hypothetical protein
VQCDKRAYVPACSASQHGTKNMQAKSETALRPAPILSGNSFSLYRQIWLPVVVGGGFVLTAAWISFLGYELFRLVENIF